MKELKNRWKIKKRNGAIKDGEIGNMKNGIDERKRWLNGRNQSTKKMMEEERKQRWKKTITERRKTYIKRDVEIKKKIESEDKDERKRE